MPGRYLTQYEMFQLITEAATPAIQKYGIQKHEEFIQALMAVAFAECGSTTEQGPVWDSQSVHDNGQGFSLFALHNQGYAGYLTPEERQDPATNAGAAAMKLGQVWKDDATFDANVQAMTGPNGQNPQDPQLLFQNAMALAKQISGAMGGIAGAMGEQGMGGLRQGGAGVPENELSSFIVSHFGLQDEEGYTASQQAMDIIMDDPWKATALFQSMTGEGSDLERRAAEAGVAIDEANARRIVAELGCKTYEQGRQRIIDQIDEKHWDRNQAINEFNAWMSATLEAGKRAETVYGEQMERAAWTTPEEHYPGTEPGGARERFAEKYGVEYTPSPGIAVETLPNLEDMYGRWQGKMGVQQQAPPTSGGWSGQALGVPQGQRWNAAQDFLQRMNLRQGAR